MPPIKSWAVSFFLYVNAERYLLDILESRLNGYGSTFHISWVKVIKYPKKTTVLQQQKDLDCLIEPLNNPLINRDEPAACETA